MKKGKEEKVAQLYSVRIDRIQSIGLEKVSVGSVSFVIGSGKIAEAYLVAQKKGDEIFGKATYDAQTKRGQYNVVQVKIVPMSVIEK